MSDANTVENFRNSFKAACALHDGHATYSHIFHLMELNANGYAFGDFVREQIQAGINDGSVGVKYGVLNTVGQIVEIFSRLENEPEINDGQTVEPIYFSPD